MNNWSFCFLQATANVFRGIGSLSNNSNSITDKVCACCSRNYLLSHGYQVKLRTVTVRGEVDDVQEGLSVNTVKLVSTQML